MLNELDDAYRAAVGLNVSDPQPFNVFSWLCYASARRAPLVVLNGEWGDSRLLWDRWAAPGWLQSREWTAGPEPCGEACGVVAVGCGPSHVETVHGDKDFLGSFLAGPVPARTGNSPVRHSFTYDRGDA